MSTKGNEGNARTNTIEFNFRRKELSDIRVRRAIAHAINVPFFIDNFLGYFAKLGTGPIPSTSTDFYPGPNPPHYPYDKAKARPCWTRRATSAPRGGTRFSLKLLPAPWGEDISLCRPSSSSRCGEIGIPVEIVRNDGGGFLKQVYDDHAFDLATGWHQYRNDPAVSTTVWYRSGQPKGAPWTNQWGWEDKKIDKIIDDAATEVDPAKRKALYAEFVKEVNTELPVWMPIEQIFVTVITAKARNHSNTPRWGSSSWHDLWLSAEPNPHRVMRILGLRGAAACRLDPDPGPDPDRRVPAAATRAGRHRRCADGADGRRRRRDCDASCASSTGSTCRSLCSSAIISGGWCASISASPRSTASRWRP